jgi:hypothetical protein
MRRLLAIGLVCGLGLLWASVGYGQEEAAPAAAPKAAIPPEGSPLPRAPIFGVEVDPEFVRLPDTVRAESAKQKGLTVRRVFPGSMADQAGIQPGDVIYKINNRFFRNYDDLMAILVNLTPPNQGRVDFVRLNATFIQNFMVDETHNWALNFFYAICARDSRYAGRFDFGGIVCNVKETKTKECGSFSFLTPLIFYYQKHGGADSVTTLIFLTFRKAQPGPVVF